MCLRRNSAKPLVKQLSCDSSMTALITLSLMEKVKRGDAERPSGAPLNR